MEKMHHIMFAFVSTVRAGAPSAPPIVYAGLAGGDDYAAIQTNESAIVYEERTLHARGEELERVYLIVTDAVKKPLTGTDKTHVGYLEGRLVRPEACPELAGRFQHIPYTDTQRDLSANMLEIASVARTVRTFMDEQRADTSCEHKFTVHADMTGGFRHASMMMTSILQILSFYDLQQGDVLYSDPDRRQGDPTYVSHPYVYKATSILNVTQLLSGTSEFVKFGSADGLKAYFRQEHTTTFSDELKGLMAAMAAFSDAIRVCSTGRLIPTLDRLGAALRAFQACEKKMSRSSSSTPSRRSSKKITARYSRLATATSRSLTGAASIIFISNRRRWRRNGCRPSLSTSRSRTRTIRRSGRSAGRTARKNSARGSRSSSSISTA